MSGFISGKLEAIEATGVYEGGVFDSQLSLRLKTGAKLEIFDDIHQLSEGLVVGEIYEMVLASTVVLTMEYSLSPLSSDDLTFYRGIIIDLHWQPPVNTFQHISPDLYGGDWVLLRTEMGDLLLSPVAIQRKVQKAIAVGGFLEWKARRLDLYAVV